MVDASDSKSDDSNIMWVQVPSPVFFYFKIYDKVISHLGFYFQFAKTLLATSVPE